MKKLNLLIIAFVALSVAFTSCKKDDDNNNSGMGGSMSLKHDGNSWSASLTVQAVNSNGVLTIAGSDSNAKQCQVTLLNIPGPGTYTLGASATNPNTGRWTQGLSGTDTYVTQVGLGSGTCTITELTSSKVSGTFEFTAKNTAGATVSITEGSFSANLSK